MLFRAIAIWLIVEVGGTISSIADRFHVPLGAILIWNRRNPSDPVHPGDQVIIHVEALESMDSGQDDGGRPETKEEKKVRRKKRIVDFLLNYSP